MHALTSHNVWFPEQKWCDSGLTLLSCLMPAMCPLNHSLNVLPDRQIDKRGCLVVFHIKVCSLP